MKIIPMSQKYAISVGKRHSHTNKYRHYRPAKTYWTVYFYDESGVFHCERTSWLKAMYYKTKKVKVIDK